MSAPLVSILIPSYNHAAYLECCIKSIQSQSLKKWELIIVDDCSRDNSISVAQQYANNDSRIRVLANESNLGTYGTEQRALSLTSAPFVAVMNSDDIWAHNKLERQVHKLESDSDAAFCYVLGAMIDADGSNMEHDVHGNLPQADPQEPLPQLLAENRILASSVLFRRASLRFEISCRYSGDWVALLEQSLHGHARFINEPLTYWRQHETNSYRRSGAQTLEEIRLRRAIHDNRELWNVRRIPKTEIKAGLAQNAMNLVPLMVYANEMRLAREFGLFAIRNHPNRKSALKRTLGLFLGNGRARKHFWSEADLAASDGERLQDQVHNAAPLRFRTLSEADSLGFDVNSRT